MGGKEFHLNLVLWVTVRTACDIAWAITGSIVKDGIADKISQVNKLDSLCEAVHFWNCFEQIDQTHRQVKSLVLRVFNCIKEKPDELKKVKPLLFYFVNLINRLNLILIQQGNKVGESVLVNERSVIESFEVDDVFDELLWFL